MFSRRSTAKPFLPSVVVAVVVAAVVVVIAVAANAEFMSKCHLASVPINFSLPVFTEKPTLVPKKNFLWLLMESRNKLLCQVPNITVSCQK